MGWFDGNSEVGSSSHHSHHSSDKRRSSSGGHKKHSSSSRSIFGFGDDRHGGSSSSFNASRSSFFGFGASSRHRARPRRGYMNKMYAQARRLFRDLVYYMKKNPFKVFMLVIMPLITGGVLTGLLAQFGIRLPVGVERMIAQLSGRPMGGMGGREGYSRQHTSFEGPLSAVGGLGGAMAGAGGLMSVAKMFM